MGEYRTIVVDPPWRYQKESTPAFTGHSIGAEHHYPTMTTDEMALIDVSSFAADDAHLYCWVTNPILTEQRPSIFGGLTAMALVRAWGFQPKALLTWRKIGRLGPGWYFRGMTEHVIFAVRGDLPVPPEDRLPNIFDGPARGHSEKPEVLMDIAERVSPPPRLELFARRQRFGWDVLGNEVGEGIVLG